MSKMKHLKQKQISVFFNYFKKYLLSGIFVRFICEICFNDVFNHDSVKIVPITTTVGPRKTNSTLPTTEEVLNKQNGRNSKSQCENSS